MMLQRIADHNPGLAIVVALFCLLGVIHSVAVPLFEAPDEVWHFSFVRMLATERALPVQPTEGKDPWLREAGQPPLYYLVAAPVIALLDTSDFPDSVRFNVAHPAVTPGVQSQAPNIFIHTHQEAFPYRGGVLAVHVARLLSVLWGAGTVVGTYLLAREILSDRPGLALLAASITAFNPHFLFISSVVNNDVCAACVCTFALWLTVRVASETGLLTGNLVSLGLVLGLASLTKMSALALFPLAALALGLAWWRERDTRGLLVQGAVTLGLAGLVGSWWYLRNWLLYGDPLAWGVWLSDLPPSRFGPMEIVRQLGHVATSYWSPYDGLFPPVVFWGLGLLVVLAAAGWVDMIGRRPWRKERPGMSAQGLLLAGVCFLLLFASLVKYMVTTPSDEGRLLFPGIAAFSLLLALGLETAVARSFDRLRTRPFDKLRVRPFNRTLASPSASLRTGSVEPLRARPLEEIRAQRWAATARVVVAGGLLLLAFASPFGAIVPRYARPLVRSTADIPQDALLNDAVSDGAQLVGIDIEPKTARPGETVSVTLYWETRATPPAALRVVVQLWTFGGRLVGQHDRTPAGDLYPPDLWRVGDVVRDTYRFTTVEERPAMCHVTVLVMDGDELLGQVSSPSALKLVGLPVSADDIPFPLTVSLGGQIELIGYDVPASSPFDVTSASPSASPLDKLGGRLRTGSAEPLRAQPSLSETLEITLYWRALVDMEEDYTVFVHLLGEDGTLYGQGDGPPLNNEYPTSYWSPGEVLADARTIPLHDGRPAGGYLLVGLYRLADGARLPVHTAEGERMPDDAVRLEIDAW
jgi:4-amino-4-deoxy-L-arabinose transferase-like glycosyltransferase